MNEVTEERREEQTNQHNSNNHNTRKTYAHLRAYNVY